MDQIIAEITTTSIELYTLLTDYNNYGTIEPSSLYFLSGCFFTIVFATIGYFRALNAFPEKKEQQWNG